MCVIKKTALFQGEWTVQWEVEGGVQFPASRSLNVTADAGWWEFTANCQSLINSPGHVVYIFRRKVEGLYLRMASLESAEKEADGTVC